MKDIRRGPRHWNWKGGTKTSSGYTYVWLPGYHRNGGTDNYAKYADIVLEEKLGRLLQPDEIAHHIDNDRSNDSPDNLEVKNALQHHAERCYEGALNGIYQGSHASQSRNSKGRFE